MYLPFFEPTDGGKDPPEPPPKKAEILSRGTPGSGFFCGRMYEKAENSPFSNGFRYFGAKYRIKLRKITLMLLTQGLFTCTVWLSTQEFAFESRQSLF